MGSLDRSFAIRLVLCDKTFGKCGWLSRCRSRLRVAPIRRNSRRLDQFVHRAVLANPLAITSRCVFRPRRGGVARFRPLVARFARVVGRNYHLYVDGHDKSAASNQTSAFQPFTWDSHNLNYTSFWGIAQSAQSLRKSDLAESAEFTAGQRPN